LFRNIANKDQVRNTFADRGFEIIDFEMLSFSEQINTVRECAAIASVHGAGLSNCIWADAGTRVLEIFCDKYLSGCYELNCKILELPYLGIVFPSDYKLCAIVDLNRLNSAIDNFLLNK
jgi:hypothetical protein